MRKEYLPAKVEIIEFETEDVIMVSNGSNTNEGTINLPLTPIP